VVGTLDKMDAFLLMIYDEAGLTHFLHTLSSNPGSDKPAVRVWRLAGFDPVQRATAQERTAEAPAMRRANACSIRLYEHYRTKFAARVAAMPTEFHERLRLLPSKAPPMEDGLRFRQQRVRMARQRAVLGAMRSGNLRSPQAHGFDRVGVLSSRPRRSRPSTIDDST